MQYYAHTDGERKQTLKEHLRGTAELAEKFAGQFGKKDWGFCCGALHDIGKYSEKYQKKITEDDSIRVDHSSAGAQLCLEKGGLYGLMSYCIAGHHSGLPDYGSSSDMAGTSSLMGRKKKKVENYQAYKEEIGIPELHSAPFDPKKTDYPDFSLSVFIRMLYSCLVDADFLDTEYFMKDGKVNRDPGEAMEVLLAKLENHIAAWVLNRDEDTVNGRRSEILRHCLECGSTPKGLFRLTVPTGGGKTIASLAFALRHAVENHMQRVIYVIPYTSIIEQNAEVFRCILGERNVLEHHYNIDYKDSDELNPMQLAAENWDKPIIVTTNVQFFESLFANRSSRCRKIHNISNSVIVFDEAQMLPNDYLKPCIAMMEELLARYDSSIVLCTATQPALMPFFQKGRKVMELCPRMEAQFRFFERVRYCNMHTIEEEVLIEELKKEHQALCIVNTRRAAQTIYQDLDGEGVFHLSTTMYPRHRKRILETIRKRLLEDEKCILISTSLVEAGVDLDFQSVYRELAGIDSMIQAAGRCNREGKRSVQESRVNVFQLEKKTKLPGQRQQIEVAETLLFENAEIAALDTVEKYFSMLYHSRGESLDKKKILKDFQGRRYNFRKAANDFQLIEENTKTVFVPVEEEAKNLLKQLKYHGYTKEGMRKAGQFCIQVYDRDFENLHGAGMLKEVSEEMQDFYELAEEKQYTEEMGLVLNVDAGMAIVM